VSADDVEWIVLRDAGLPEDDRGLQGANNYVACDEKIEGKASAKMCTHTGGCGNQQGHFSGALLCVMNNLDAQGIIGIHGGGVAAGAEVSS
jgi:hypothetical protein